METPTSTLVNKQTAPKTKFSASKVRNIERKHHLEFYPEPPGGTLFGTLSWELSPLCQNKEPLPGTFEPLCGIFIWDLSTFCGASVNFWTCLCDLSGTFMCGTCVWNLPVRPGAPNCPKPLLADAPSFFKLLGKSVLQLFRLQLKNRVGKRKWGKWSAVYVSINLLKM